MQSFLQQLNNPQLEAATHIDGPIIIIAGAGSGKTKVLTTRIAYLLSKEVSPFNILALTFTNKAAKEMKERIEKMLHNVAVRNLYIGTFHSVFARVLRSEAEKLGYPSNFTIYDSEDCKSIIKTIVQNLQLDEKLYKPSIVLNRISNAKNNLIDEEEYNQRADIQQEDFKLRRGSIGKIYSLYVLECYRNGAMDFDDLLLKMYKLLHEYPECLSKYQQRFKYILIDEYQDTNVLQYKITKLLAAANENICVVGDDAQSIYSFRGATIENILQFKKDYDNVKVVKLEQNYRSTNNILTAANAVIKNNKNQIPKNLWTEKLGGEKIKLIRTASDNDEGKYVADSIQENKLRNHYNNNDFAILYRTNAQSRAFEESLRRHGIAYKIYGGLSFYQRKEIKDFLAYLRLIVNPNDNEALKRIINVPVRGIGKTTIEKCLIISAEKNISFFQVTKNAHLFGFKNNALTSLSNFAVMINYFQTLLESKQNAYQIAFEVSKHTNIAKEYFNDKSVEGLARYENLQELLNSIKEFTETPDNEDGEVFEKTLGSYLQQISLVADMQDDKENADTVKLMTIHAAKGLEFLGVFVVGLEESLFPNSMVINSPNELEEERRLFYVAITRAKEKLWLLNAQMRYKFGQLTQNEASRFIEEIPIELIEESQQKIKDNNNLNKPTHYNNPIFNTNKSYNNETNIINSKRVENKTPIINIDLENFKQMPTDSFKANQTIEHIKFGRGKILQLDGNAQNPIAHILFDNFNGEVKKILLNYAKMRVI